MTKKMIKGLWKLYKNDGYCYGGLGYWGDYAKKDNFCEMNCPIYQKFKDKSEYISKYCTPEIAKEICRELLIENDSLRWMEVKLKEV